MARKDAPIDDAPRGFSRRDFLRGGAAAGVLGAGVFRGVPSAEPAPAAKAGKKEAGVQIAGPGAVAMSFRINGQAMSARLEPRVTLLDALRTRFELTGAKRVCDRGTCGACTVLLDGKPVYACSFLAIEAQDAAIETVEGLGSVDKLHPLQAAFVENDAQQCGFCTPGFIVAARALLDRNPHPTLAEVHHGLSGNFCRCGTYAGIRQAVLQAAQRGGARSDDDDDSPGAASEPGQEERVQGQENQPAPGKKHGKKKKKKRKGGGGHGGR